MKVDWENQYEHLRTMHSHLKHLMKEHIGNIPHFAGDRRKELPDIYYKKLEKINDALYVAEKYVSKRMF